MIAFVLLAACNQAGNHSKLYEDNPRKGTIYISVDESFRPVVEQQIKVYEASFPGTHIIASYKSEADCFRDLQRDSTRMVIVARGLTKDESVFFENKLSYRPQYDIVAYDAVAAIVNIHAPDSIFTMQQLRDILDGKTATIAVMDGRNSTSTVRYLQDTVLTGRPFGKNVMAAAGSDSVIAIIERTSNTIGFIGMSWVGNEYEAQQLEDLKKIRLARLECIRCVEKGYFAKPSQASISYAQYPLARPLYYILKENATGLGTGFTNYLGLERGQLVFRRALLVPAKMNFTKRNVTQ